MKTQFWCPSNLPYSSPGSLVTQLNRICCIEDCWMVLRLHRVELVADLDKNKQGTLARRVRRATLSTERRSEKLRMVLALVGNLVAISIQLGPGHMLRMARLGIHLYINSSSSLSF